MKKEKNSAMGTPYTFEGRIPLKQAIPLTLHLDVASRHMKFRKNRSFMQA